MLLILYIRKIRHQKKNNFYTFKVRDFFFKFSLNTSPCMTKQNKTADSITNIQNRNYDNVLKKDKVSDSKSNSNDKHIIESFQKVKNNNFNLMSKNINAKSYQKLLNSELSRIIKNFAKREQIKSQFNSILQEILVLSFQQFFEAQISNLLIVQKNFSLYQTQQSFFSDMNDDNDQMKSNNKSLLIVNKNQDQRKGCFGQIYKGVILTPKNKKQSLKIKKIAVKASILNELQYKNEGYIINYHRERQIYEQIFSINNLRKQIMEKDTQQTCQIKQNRKDEEEIQNEMQDKQTQMQTQMITQMQTQIQNLSSVQTNSFSQTQFSDSIQIQRQVGIQIKTRLDNQQKYKNSENIVRYYGSFQDQQSNLYLILDYVQNFQQKSKSSLNILDLIQNKGLNDKQLFDIMYQIMKALYHLQYEAISQRSTSDITSQNSNQKILSNNHFTFGLLNDIQTIRDKKKYVANYYEYPKKIYEDLGIIYRDLKPQNILCYKECANQKYKIKLCDFGVSKIANINQRYSFTKCGTPLYSSPQVSNMSGHSGKTDVWSYGVVLLQFLSQQFRNWINNQRQTYYNCQKGKNIIQNVMKFKNLYKVKNENKIFQQKEIKYASALNQILQNCLIQSEQNRWSVKQLNQYMDLMIQEIQIKTQVKIPQNQDLSRNDYYFMDQCISIQKMKEVFKQNQRDIGLIIE